MASKEETLPDGSDSSELGKKKIMSSKLLNMKFMQRSLDAELAAELKKQQDKEVSESQWHLSIVKESSTIKQSTTTRQVTYEPSYAAFESLPGEIAKAPDKKTGRRIFGSFVPDIDELIKEATDEAKEAEDEDDEHQQQPQVLGVRKRKNKETDKLTDIPNGGHKKKKVKTKKKQGKE